MFLSPNHPPICPENQHSYLLKQIFIVSPKHKIYKILIIYTFGKCIFNIYFFHLILYCYDSSIFMAISVIHSF